MFLSSLAAVLRGPGQRPQPGSPSESRSGVGGVTGRHFKGVGKATGVQTPS